MNVGARIKIRRKEINMKAYELASKINVSLSTLYRYEKGDIEKMSTDVLKEIADALSTTPADLMGWDETEETILSKITTAASKLEEERQEKVLGYCEDQLSEQERGGRELPTVDERFTNVTDIYRRLTPDRQEEARRSMNRQLRSQNIVKMEEIQKAQDLYESLGEEFEDIGLYGEVSAGTGVWVSDEPVEIIKYPVPVPNHDIALRVNGNSMEPMFHDGDVVFVKKTPEVHHGSIIIIIVNDSAYIKKLYRRDDEVRLISLNPQYEDIVLNPDDTIEIIGNVIM
jgi:phage repressor protein C with HTH and peptisase S24 domain